MKTNVFLLVGSSLMSVASMAEERPNVIVIIADQWSTSLSDGSGIYSTGVRTPNVDRLASQGVRFEQSYSTYPLSTPARACFYTGLYPHKNKAIFNENLSVLKDSLPANVQTMGRLFAEAGYETAYFGKQHAANYAGDGIQEFGSMIYSDGGMLAEGSAYDQIFLRDAISFLEREHDKPFYMNLSLINPHDICKVIGGKVKGATFADAIHFCREDDELYLRYQKRIGLPGNFNIPYVPGMILDKDFMYTEVFSQSENDWKRYISTYCLLMENTDWLIGLLLDAVDKAGLSENTIVVFTTDHGDMMGSHKLIAKTTFYEESAKTMMCIRYPKKINAGSVNEEALVGSIDLMPTLLDMCNIDIPASLDGRSFKEQCYYSDKNGKHEILYSMNYFGRMVRFGDYKYVRTSVYGKEFNILFDLKKDPQEANNVFNQIGYEQVSSEAKRLLDNFLQREKLGLIFKR